MRERAASRLDAPVAARDLCLDVDASWPLERLTDALDDLCRRAAELPDAIVVLRLRPCAGESRAWPGEVPLAAINRWERAARRFERLAAVTVVLAQDTCSGPSLRLLLAADHRIATSGLRLVPPASDGLFWPGMELHRIVQEIGLARARRIVLSGAAIGAEQALELGLVDQIGDDLDDALRSAVARLGRLLAGERAIRRALALEATTTTFEEALGAHLAACDRELRRCQP